MNARLERSGRRDATPPDIDAPQLERALRAELTDIEYRTLQARLTGAIKAVETLRQRAPDLAKRVWGNWAVHASPNLLDSEARSWIEGVVAELLHVERHPHPHVGHVQLLVKGRRPVLKIVMSRGRGAAHRKVK